MFDDWVTTLVFNCMFTSNADPAYQGIYNCDYYAPLSKKCSACITTQEKTQPLSAWEPHLGNYYFLPLAAIWKHTLPVTLM